MYIFAEERTLEQISVTVNPTTTVYTFTHPVCDFEVMFFTPLLMDKPEVMSRPVSYVYYTVKPKEEGHTYSVYFDASCQLAGDLVGQTFELHEEQGHAWMGSKSKRYLSARETMCAFHGDICILSMRMQE